MQAQIDINQVVFQTIRDRFQYHENTEAEFDNNSTRFLLRENIEGSAENLERVRSIMEAHTRLSDEQLQEVLNLRPATEEGITESTWILYVRSWTVPAATMGRLLGEWQDLYEFPETEGWLNLAREFNDEPMHLRYVGVVTGRAAVERHQEDISHAYGILGRFLNGLEEIDQATFDAARIYEFARRETTETPGPVRELMERIGIAFFGVERVLNVQHGGYLNTYEPDMATVQHLSAYGAGFFGAFRDEANGDQGYRRFPLADLQPWLDAVQQQCQTMNLPFPQDYRNLLEAQGRPCMVHGHAILTIAGSDVTREDFQQQRRFFGGSRAGAYTKTILARQCQQLEDGLAEYARDDLEEELFPFVDLFPWYKIVGTAVPAVRQLSIYMNAVQPLVVATHSSIATSVALANFVHERGLKEDRTPFLDHVGVPRLAYHLNPEWPASGDPEPGFDLAVVVIPHIDPGYERYGRRSQLLNKIIELTWLITSLVAEVAVKQSIPHRINGHLPDTRRRDGVMRGIWDRVNPDLTPEESDMDASLFDALKELGDLKDEFKRERRLTTDNSLAPDTPLTAATRQVLIAAGVEKMGRYEHAQGEAGSQEREAQVTRLWRSNYPALHIHIGRDQEQAWRDWALTRDEGTSYLAAAMRNIGTQVHHPLHNSLKRFRPEEFDSQDESWLEVDEHVNRATALWGEAMKSSLDPSFYGPEQQRARVLRRWQEADPERFTPRTELDGTLVYCSLSSPTVVHWQDGNEARQLHYQFPRAVIGPASYEERIFHLRFLEGGLGLDRQNGEQVLQNGERTIVTIGQLEASNDAHHWMRAWLRERQRLNPDGPEQHRAEVEQILAMFENVPANRLRNAPGNASKPSAWDKFRNGNIFETDALGLLRRFLNEEFPQGGHVHLAPTEEQWFRESQRQVPEGYVSLKDRFNDFLNAHIHPKRPFWQQKLNNMKNGAQHFFKNVDFLRPGSETRQIKFTYGRSKRQFIVIDIAALPEA